MPDFDFDEIEEELDLVVPNIYRHIIDAVNAKGLDLRKFHIHYNTQTVLKGNWKLRTLLADSDPKWGNEYFDFGVGDGCGNYFFLHASEEEDDIVQLWSHDPPDIEDVSTGTEFLASLLAELETGFTGPDKYRFQGHSSE